MSVSLASFVLCFFSIQGCLAATAVSPPYNAFKSSSAYSVNLWKLNQQEHQQSHNFLVLSQESRNFASSFPTQWFIQPLDHFAKNSPTFGQRYWVNSRHYIPGSGRPVIVIDGGEITGEKRLGLLDTGIADILAKATSGVAVVLEHRYYGMYQRSSQHVVLSN
jgi:Serine carboxypeptidase S28